MDLVVSRLNSTLYVLRVMERMLHGGESWAIRLGEKEWPGWNVSEDYFGFRIRPHVPAPLVCSPVLLCEGSEIMYHCEITLPAQIATFTWWFSVVPIRT